MNSISKKKRVALVGNAVTDKKKNEDDVVAGIIKTMDAAHTKYSNEKVEAYQSMLENRNYNNLKASGDQAKFDVLAEEMSNQRLSKLSTIESKKVFPTKKHPLMAKCQKNLKYLKHNRAIPKQRAHVGTLPMPPVESSVKKKVCKKKGKESLPYENSINAYSGNIWMVNEFNKKLLQSSDSSETEENTPEQIESPIKGSDTRSSDSDSNFESFIKSQKQPLPDHDMSVNNVNKKRKKTRKLKKISSKKLNSDSAKSISENNKLTPECSPTSTPDGDDSLIENGNTGNFDSDIQWEIDNIPNLNPVEKIPFTKQKDCNEILGSKISQSNSEIELAKVSISDCSVKLVRNPTLDNRALTNERLDEQIYLSSKSNEEVSEFILNDAMTKNTNETDHDSEDDCMIIDVVPKSNSNRGFTNESHCTNPSDKPVLAISVKSTPDVIVTNDGLTDAFSLNSTLTPNLYSDEKKVISNSLSDIDKDLGIQILSVTSLGNNSNEHSDKNPGAELLNEAVNHSTIQISEERSHTDNSYYATDDYRVPEQTPQISVDELLSKVDIENIKKFAKPHSTVPYNNNINSLLRREDLHFTSKESDIVNSVISKSVETNLSKFPTTSNQECSKEVSLQNASVSLNNKIAHQNILRTMDVEGIKNILSNIKPDNYKVTHEPVNCSITTAHRLTLSSIDHRNLSPNGYESIENKSNFSIDNSLKSEAFWNNLKQAISANSTDLREIARGSKFNTLLSEETISPPTQLNNSNSLQPSTSTGFCATNCSVPVNELPINFNGSQCSKSTVIHQSDKTESQSITEHNYVENSSDELDDNTASGIQELCQDPEPSSVLSLIKLYARESHVLSNIKLAGHNMSEGLKIFEKNQAKKVKCIEQAIESYCKRDPCFYKVMVEGNFIKSGIPIKHESTSKELIYDSNACAVSENYEFNDERSKCKIALKQQKAVCQNCGRIALIKCLGCSKVFFCSEKCGISYWEKTHHLECEKKIIINQENVPSYKCI